jgi:hypothetical protein
LYVYVVPLLPLLPFPGAVAVATVPSLLYVRVDVARVAPEPVAVESWFPEPS